MTTDLLELSESIITGRTSIEARHPVAMMGVTELHELADGLAFIESFANVTAFDVDDRLVLIDAGGILAAGKVHRALRDWSDSPLDTAVYTHGHVDHVFGVPMFDAEEAPIRPTVVAHVNVPRRFDRYQLTNGYNGWINQRQFQLPEPMFPRDFRYPDRTYEHDLELEVGGLRIELHHDKGETDDGTWAWIPERSVLCTGDLFIWAAPNCGNPQKVQRFPWEWAVALRRMAAVGAELMLPGHGLPVAGRDRIQMVLTSAAELLESIHDQTLELMNAGRDPGRPDPHRLGARAPDRPAVAAAGLRRARVRGAQPVASVRRLVRRRPVHPQARSRGRPGRRAHRPGGRGLRAGRPRHRAERAGRPSHGLPPGRAGRPCRARRPCRAPAARRRSTPHGPSTSARSWPRASTAGRSASRNVW